MNSITHHPDEAALIDYANDTLDEAASLVIAAHVALCPDCQRSVRAFECIGGALLGALDPNTSSGTPDFQLLDRAPANLDHASAAEPAATHAAAETNLPSAVARMLALYPAQDWKWLGPGIRWKPVLPAGADGVRAFLLKAQPGTQMPQHTHEGIEWTQVLTGAFKHEFGYYGPGDFDGADENVNHRPVVDASGECICLVAMRGQLQLQGFAGRLLQPFVRF